MESLIKAGDLVRLKISDQQMTVKGFATKPASQEASVTDEVYECVWYAQGKQQKAIFHKDALIVLAPHHDYLHYGNYE
jgi:uncharacterized protein YodC (DUF2158 family)